MRVTTVVIGAGHNGLAMSRCLTERSIDHVVLERGEIANSWKTERWDSLRLLTPNWLSRLPGHGYQGDDPDGFRTMPETIEFIEGYAGVVSAPVRPHTRVTSVRSNDDGYLVATDQGDWHCRTVVLATGATAIATLPPFASALPPGIQSLTPTRYRNPAQLEHGGVLVVGASASGTQIAEEVHRSGRPVTIAVGEHVRVPRTYRGRDILWWMDGAGVLDDRYDEVDDLTRARNVPSPQLAGSVERHTVDLNRLTGMGVRMVGRLAGIAEGRAQFSGSLRNKCELADLKMNRLFERIDAWATRQGLDGEVEAPRRFEPTRVDDSPRLLIDLREFRTIIWATGFRPDFSIVELPVFDPRGRIRHDGGAVQAPGLYVIGLSFLRRRKSTLIDGASADAREVSDHLAAFLDHRMTMEAGAQP
jgi:putative flavoprotein involved in K+ transport